MKDRLRRLAARLLVASGAVAVGRRFFVKGGAVILYGHRVADDDEGYLEGLRPDWLDAQLGYLTSHYEVISLEELVSCFEQRRAVPDKSVVLTLDDGFRDNYEVALPLFEKHHVPATVFLVTGSVTHGDLPWSQRLGFLFQNTASGSLSCDPVSGRDLDLSTPAAKRRAYNAVKTPMKRMALDQRERVLGILQTALSVEPPRDRMLTWDLVREARERGMEFGAHTHSHALAAMVDYDEAKRDIERSLHDIRDRLGIASPFFCFPAGSTNRRLIATVRELGFRSAFRPSTRRRPNTLDDADQFTLRRFGMPNGRSGELAAELDGPLNLIRSIAHRVGGAVGV